MILSFSSRSNNAQKVELVILIFTGKQTHAKWVTKSLSLNFCDNRVCHARRSESCFFEQE